MKLSRALRIKSGQLVAFTGAGGKTSGLHQLIRELSPDMPLLITTTTKLGVDQFGELQSHVVDDGRGLADVADELARARVLLWTGPADESRLKWSGLKLDRLDQFKELAADMGAVILVEADGARQRWLKAPAEHEPVIPMSADLVVPVVNLAALGAKLDSKTAHRPELIGDLISSQVGAAIQAEHLVSLITNPRGGLKGIPPAAEVRPLLNGVSLANPSDAVDIAKGCLQQSQRVTSVVLADLATGKEPLFQNVSRVAGVVLAAGGASRMGDLKQLRQWQGKSLVRHSVDAAQGAGLSPIVVITGHQGERVRVELASARVQFAHNEDWQRGQSTSMKLGLKRLGEGVEAVVFLLADMPLVGPDLVMRLLDRHRRQQPPIVAPVVKERYGNPVLFDRITFPALMAVDGDTGGKAIFEQFTVSAIKADRSALMDVDTDDDWEQLESP